MRGRKPKPTVLKDLHGSEEPRNPAEPIATTGSLTDTPADSCPAYFTADMRDTWEYVLQHSPLGMLKRIDAPMLEAWVITVCALRDATREYIAAGQVTQNGKSSPSITVIKSMTAVLRALGSELGFSPVSRTRIQSGLSGEALGPTTTHGHAQAQDNQHQSLDQYLASAPKPSSIN